jgi:hypothetical protein
LPNVSAAFSTNCGDSSGSAPPTTPILSAANGLSETGLPTYAPAPLRRGSHRQLRVGLRAGCKWVASDLRASSGLMEGQFRASCEPVAGRLRGS